MRGYNIFMDRNKFQLAADFAIRSLDRFLLPELFYHNLEHTRDEVVLWTSRLADLEGVEGNDRLVLLTAAYYHDIGWIQIKESTEQEYSKRLQHENYSAEYARQVLPHYGYSRAEIDQVCELILVTRLSEKPKNLAEKIIRDADLSSLGQGLEVFWKRGNDLLREMRAFGIVVDDVNWLLVEEDLLRKMVYFTGAARGLFDIQKQAALESVRAQLALLKQ